jgi:hypothetical protein
MPSSPKVTDSLLADVISCIPRAVEFSFPIAFFKAQKWLRECDGKHSCAPQAVKLPTQVLDLGENIDSQHVILVESNEQYGRYITLS